MSKVSVCFVFVAILLSVSAQSTDNRSNNGRQSSRQTTDAHLVAPLVASLWTLFSTGKVGPVVAPVLVKFLVVPLLAIIRSVAKGLLFVGVLGYLISALVPVFLSYVGMYGNYSYTARSRFTDYWPLGYINETLVPKISSLLKSVLNMLQINGSGCQQMLSCKSGQAMANNFPNVVNIMNRLGIIKVLEASFIGDNQTSILVSAMAGDDNCSQQRYTCHGVEALERLFGQVDDHISSFETTTTTSLPPLSRDHNSMSDILRVVAHSYLQMYNSTGH